MILIRSIRSTTGFVEKALECNGCLTVDEAQMLIDGSPNGAAGYSKNGQYAIIPIWEDTNKHAVCIFQRVAEGWARQGILIPDAGHGGFVIGSASGSISPKGDYAIVSVVDNKRARRRAFIFARSGTAWMEEAELIGTDILGGSSYGSSASFSDDAEYVILGASGERNTATDSGVAYIFKKSSGAWIRHAKLTSWGSTLSNCSYSFGTDTIMGGDGSYCLVTGTRYSTSSSGSDYKVIYGFRKVNDCWVKCFIIIGTYVKFG